MNPMVLYRIGNYAHRNNIPLLPWLMHRCCLFLFSADIPMKCQIGKNVEFGHFGLGVVLNDKVVIGDNVIIYHGVTIGRSRGIVDSSEHEKRLISIEIGANTIIGAGSIILAKEGLFRVGSNCQIGAGSIVTKSVPDGITTYGAQSNFKS